MRTSDGAYVWVWLPGATEPVVAGAIRGGRGGISFRYAASFLERSGAVSLGPDLPLEDRVFPPAADLGMPGTLRDASPDAWGRRVILNRLTGRHGRDTDPADLSEMTYLLESGTNRFGALDFQISAKTYAPRGAPARLDDLHRAASLVEEGKTLPADLAESLVAGTTIGGARPKAILEDAGVGWVAKFSTSSDPYSVVGAEAASIELAGRSGIRVPRWKLAHSLGRSVLLTERFDREGGGRILAVSGLTVLGLGEMTSRYGSYIDLLEESGGDRAMGRELFARIAFNMAISNTDDHLRNHAFFWDGSRLALTPAFDLSPANRSGETASQAIAYDHAGHHASDLAALADVAHEYGLSRGEGIGIITRIIDAIEAGWDDASEKAELTHADQDLLWHRQILNPGTVREFLRRRMAR